MSIQNELLQAIPEQDAIKLAKIGRVFINLLSSTVRPYHEIKRCYKCQGHGHTSLQCTNRECCGKCGQHHDTRKCTATTKDALIAAFTMKQQGKNTMLTIGHSTTSATSTKEEKSISWKKFCTEAASPYKTAFQKFLKSPTAHNTIDTCDSEENIKNILSTLFQQDDPTDDNESHKSMRTAALKIRNKQHQTKSQPPNKFTKEEIDQVIKNLPEKKAPGPDGKIVKIIHNTLPNIFPILFNKCLALGSFPEALKYGEIVLFNKPDKDPKDPNSYRPITLLPTIGKCLEKLLLTRLQYFYHINKLLNSNQFGFQNEISTEHAMNNLMNLICKNKRETKYTILISIDIKGAFNSLWWPSILQALSTDGCPTELINTITDYLDNRNTVNRNIDNTVA
ncbi:RNA-directed DNA polymerase from mobile element jockey [Caerostris extrusa]|uniref:RNA-directed DNA polymerase from mobile element jockey n=1 Tax=Caerostris extrusa TaxID=172846 RepID=A0AAV4MY04_CAEEX|nr:RNA-directed DNA polymerase from mobile element jockey [Caerostris extrusa]